MEKLIDLLHEGDYSCVIGNREIRTFSQKGVADLYDLLNDEPDFLNGSRVADKVIGKAAAALMILGKVQEVYTDLISEPGLALLEGAGVKICYKELVPFIRNRDQTGWCPLENSCEKAPTAEEVLPLVEAFIVRIRGGK